ncbi:unnamed protein product [Caenorhabditis angaria]|uniref:Uncharacterized protein n=1 Tax=Caenorhabditis angaria TaxID=860376 RepID=A0A9P1ILF8_9PELO|nr:unnamed protein product [Caenorhabditis angaria]
MLILVILLFALANGCNIRPKCEDGWIQIQRQLGVWCAKIVHQSDYWSKCRNKGGRRSSIESLDEMNIYLNELKSMGESYAYLNMSIVPECWCGSSTCPVTETCPIPSMWQWNDKFTVSNELMSRVEPYYNNSYGVYNMLLTTENELGLTDRRGIVVNTSLCGKEGIS